MWATVQDSHGDTVVFTLPETAELLEVPRDNIATDFQQFEVDDPIILEREDDHWNVESNKMASAIIDDPEAFDTYEEEIRSVLGGEYESNEPAAVCSLLHDYAHTPVFSNRLDILLHAARSPHTVLENDDGQTFDPGLSALATFTESHIHDVESHLSTIIDATADSVENDIDDESPIVRILMALSDDSGSLTKDIEKHLVESDEAIARLVRVTGDGDAHRVLTNPYYGFRPSLLGSPSEYPETIRAIGEIVHETPQYVRVGDLLAELIEKHPEAVPNVDEAQKNIRTLLNTYPENIGKVMELVERTHPDTDFDEAPHWPVSEVEAQYALLEGIDPGDQKGETSVQKRLHPDSSNVRELFGRLCLLAAEHPSKVGERIDLLVDHWRHSDETGLTVDLAGILFHLCEADVDAGREHVPIIRDVIEKGMEDEGATYAFVHGLSALFLVIESQPDTVGDVEEDLEAWTGFIEQQADRDSLARSEARAVSAYSSVLLQFWAHRPEITKEVVGRHPVRFALSLWDTRRAKAGFLAWTVRRRLLG